VSSEGGGWLGKKAAFPAHWGSKRASEESEEGCSRAGRLRNGTAERWEEGKEEQKLLQTEINIWTNTLKETETLMLQAGHQQKTFAIEQLWGQKGYNATRATETEISVNMHPNPKQTGIAGHCSLTVQWIYLVQQKNSFEHLCQFLPCHLHQADHVSALPLVSDTTRWSSWNTKVHS